jgi:hypothetical protein
MPVILDIQERNYYITLNLIGLLELLVILMLNLVQELMFYGTTKLLDHYYLLEATLV